MSVFITGTGLDTKQGEYRTGKAAQSIGDNSWLQTVRLRRRQLGRMMQAFDVETAKNEFPTQSILSVVKSMVNSPACCFRMAKPSP